MQMMFNNVVHLEIGQLFDVDGLVFRGKFSHVEERATLINRIGAARALMKKVEEKRFFDGTCCRNHDIAPLLW